MKHLFIIFISVIFFSSCFIDQIELDLNDDNEKVVILAWITDLNEPQFVKISKTVNYLGNLPEVFVSDASVVISDSERSYTLEERKSGHYYLPLDWTARIGDTYSLEVFYDDKEYTSSYVMNSCPEIENAIYEQYNIDEDTDSIPTYETVFGFQETPGEGDAYFAVDYLKGTMAGDSLDNGGFADDEFVDGEFFDDIRLSEDDRLFRRGDVAVIELFSIGKEAADFLFDIRAETFRGGPFDPPPANVRTNISGGALGFFIASGAQQIELKIE